MKQIFNEGRVVGYSAYELYIRQVLSQNPDAPVPTEREWLSSSIGYGNSMLLRVPAGTSAGYHDYPLPAKSNLCACTEILASPFVGSAIFDAQGMWAVQVNSYGQLIRNDSQMSPETPGMSVPTDVDETTLPNDQFLSNCAEYSNIVDGIVFQPGNWTDYKKYGIEKAFEPNIDKPSVVRIWFREETKSELLLLLHGFLDKSVIRGTTGFESCVDTPNPENGDFLGPMSFPWAVRISFIVTSAVDGIINRNMYSRIFPSTNPDETVKVIQAKTCIDYESTDPKDFYESEQGGEYSGIPVNVISMAASSVNSIAAHQLADLSEGSEDVPLPPIIVGAKLSESGEQRFYPLDIGAPGTVKVFEDNPYDPTDHESGMKKANTFMRHVQGGLAIYRDHEGKLYYSNGKSVVPLSGDMRIHQYSPEYPDAYVAEIGNGSVIPLQSSTDASMFNIAGSAETISAEALNWAILLTALSKNQSIELLPSNVKSFAENNLQNYLDNEHKVNNLKIAENYIEFNGVRLYISNSEPEGDIPPGSIGIGW